MSSLLICIAAPEKLLLLLAARGANVIIANRTVAKAEELASGISPTTQFVSLEDLVGGKIEGDILANTTSIGMQPAVGVSPVPKSILGKASFSSFLYASF